MIPSGVAISSCFADIMDVQPLQPVPPAQFRRLIQVERARADRSGLSFALAVFRFSAGCRTQAANFSQTVAKRIRLIDHLGWLNPDLLSLGVLLGDTDARGAEALARNVLAALPETDRPAVDVFFYPEPPADSGSGAASASPTAAGAAASAEVTAPVACQVRPLTDLFVCPLPLWKRTIDLVLASLGLLLISPQLLTVADLIKLTSPGPVLFKQRRLGLGGRPFTIFKFRTMGVDAEARKAALRQFSEQDGPAFKMAADPRITRVGHILRKTAIDELPQLWNVIRGEMTLVGPRPLPVDEANGCDQWQRRRLEVTPGLTCIWQVYGMSRVSFAEWMRMDIRYIRTGSFWKDMKLIQTTLLAVLRAKASQ